MSVEQLSQAVGGLLRVDDVAPGVYVPIRWRGFDFRIAIAPVGDASTLRTSHSGGAIAVDDFCLRLSNYAIGEGLSGPDDPLHRSSVHSCRYWLGYEEDEATRFWLQESLRGKSELPDGSGVAR